MAVKFWIRVFEEVAGVHQAAEPRGFKAVENAQEALGRAGEAPVIFEGEDDAALLGLGETAMPSMHHLKPSSSVRPGRTGSMPRSAMSWSKLCGAPAAGVDADGRAAEFVGELDALFGVLDFDGELGGVGLHETLMGRHAADRETVAKGVALQAVEVAAARSVERGTLGNRHLPVENIDALDAELGGAVHDGFDGDLGRLEMPIRIRRDAEFHAFAGRGGGFGRGGGEGGGAKREGGTGGEGRSEEGAAVEGHGRVGANW